MKYNFFDYKEFIEGYHGQDMFSMAHIIVMVSLFVVLILLCIFLRKIKHSYVNGFLKVLAIAMPILEVAKITWETYWDSKMGYSFNYTGLLPLYTCSMFMYTLPFAAFGKGKAKEYALAFLTTLGIFSGLTNFVYLNILYSYPLFTYSTFMSINYHFLMVFTGIFLIVTNYYRPKFVDCCRAMIVLWLFSLIVIPANFIMYNYSTWVDYMLYMRGAGLPVLYDISLFFEGINFKLGFSLFMATIGYGIVTLLTFGIYKVIMIVIKKHRLKEFY